MLVSLTLEEALKHVVERLYGVLDVVPEVVVQQNPKFGEYSSSVPLGLGRRLGKKPQEVGNEIIETLSGNQDLKAIVDRVELAGAGFLNFYLNDTFVLERLKRIFKEGFEYENIGSGERLQLEFVSANPTGPLTLANGRAGFFGDVMGRILQRSGYQIEREYYVNDAGNQIETLGKSVSHAAGSYSPREDEELYKGEYIAELAAKYEAEVEQIKDFEKLGQIFVEKELLPSIQASLDFMRVGFDRFTSEQRDVREKGLVERFMRLVNGKSLAYEQDGAWWLKTTEFGDDKDRVLVTSDKQYTYLAVDAGHYLETVERDFISKINLLGADHHGYINRIQAVAKIVNLKRSEIIIMQIVKLMRNGQEVRMTKRKGTYVTIDEVLEELGPDAARYFFLSRAPSSQLTIDLDLAKEESKENPVFYIQYAGARISSVLEKVSALDAEGPGTAEIAQEDAQFAKKILFWNEAVHRAACERLVHPLAEYAYNLADSFHTFYEQRRVIEGGEVHPSRKALVLLYKKAFSEVFEVLGVKFLEKM